MDLIERYIYAVTRHMPIDQREDVADELRANIQDALDKRGSHTKKDVKAVLTELGNPIVLAERYKGGSRYLIGPILYPYYIRALKLTFTIGIPIALALAVISQIIANPQAVGEFITGVLSILITAILHMIFWVSATFVIFERMNVTEETLQEGDSWTPDSLPAVKADRLIPISDAIGDIVWYLFIGLLPFVAVPLIGAYLNSQMTPFFNPEIGTIWLITAVVFGLIGVLLGLLQLKIRKWTPALVTFNTVFTLAFCAALIALPFLTQVVNPAFLSLLDENITSANLAEITRAVNWTVGISIAVIVGINLYDVFNAIRLSRKSEK